VLEDFFDGEFEQPNEEENNKAKTDRLAGIALLDPTPN
jgi:hypothetical protein